MVSRNLELAERPRAITIDRDDVRLSVPALRHELLNRAADIAQRLNIANELERVAADFHLRSIHLYHLNIHVIAVR